VGRDLILGRGVLGGRIARDLGIDAIGSQTDLTTVEGREEILSRINSESIVWVALRPKPWVDPELFYVRTATLAPLLAARRCRVVLLSSSAVYGENECAGENDPLCPTTPYGFGKLAEEAIFMAAFGSMGLLVLRVFDTFGPDSAGVVKALRKAAFAAVRPRLSPQLTMDFLHVDDASQLIQTAVVWWLRDNSTTILNIGSGIGHNLQEVWELLDGGGFDEEPQGRPSCVADVARLSGIVGSSTLSMMADRLKSFLWSDA